jgi:hypothetical protein
MNHEVTLQEYSKIYGAIQTGEIEGVKMGDTINGKFLMVNSFHLEPLQDEPYFEFEETIRNNSTKHTFVETYIATKQAPLYNHLEILSVTKTPIV